MVLLDRFRFAVVQELTLGTMAVQDYRGFRSRRNQPVDLRYLSSDFGRDSTDVYGYCRLALAVDNLCDINPGVRGVSIEPRHRNRRASGQSETTCLTVWRESELMSEGSPGP
jgi:hypothetical protein